MYRTVGNSFNIITDENSYRRSFFTVRHNIFIGNSFETLRQGNGAKIIDQAYIGITDFAQNALGNIVYVDMPDIDDELESGDDFGAVESVKAASDMTLPVSGTVIEINEALEDHPELINQDAFANWIIKIKLSDKTELDELMNAKDYEAFCNK